MKIVKILSILLIMLSLATFGFAQGPQRTGKIIELKGSVDVKPLGKEMWIPAAKDMTLKQGDSIRTRDKSTAILNLNGSGETATVEINENSQLQLEELIKDSYSGAEQTLLDLSLGKILIKAKKLHSERSKFEVKTPTSVVGVRGTVFSVEVEVVE